MSKNAAQKRTALPSKEASLFKELLTLYEAKQLKKGLKTADQILKKFPEHGETLCMKGLVLTHMGRRDEGIDLVKKGIKLDLMSHICWHVFGLIQKADRNYEEALKSYTQALRFDKENMNLLRDSAQLQMHLRLFENAVETRHTILRLRPNQRQNWMALAVAHHLNGNLEEAKMVLESYFRSLKNVPKHDVEHSESLLYYIRILEDLENFTEALSALNEHENSGAIVDQQAVLETRARLLTKQGSPDAKEGCRALVDYNPNSYDAYRGYLELVGVSFEVPSQEAVDILSDFINRLPRATAPYRLQLKLSSGDQFKELLHPYILVALEKGVPSLFADLKTLYAVPEKRKTIEEVAASLRKDSSPPHDKDIEPANYLWTLYFLAQHYSHLSQHSEALSLLDIALSHTPTLPELYMLRGRILKRLGDYVGAARSMNDARLLDGQDRFLNTKCGKYLLRAGMVDEALGLFALFTKKDTTPAADLQDMQSLLYLLAEADAHRRNGKLNMALKRYMAVKAIFDDFENDQFDFHGYNLRKFTMNIYLRLLEWEDRLRSHPAYITAAIEASKIFVQAHDDPSMVTALSKLSNQLTDAEKKAKKKARKAEKKKEEVGKKAPPQANADKELDTPPKKDEDPDGFKLLGSADGLEQAAKILQPLTTLAANLIDVWIALYDVSIRRKKLLQAVGALNRATEIDSDHPELHVRLVDLRRRASGFPQIPPAPIGPVFMESVAKLIPDESSSSLETFNSVYLQRNGSEAEAHFAAARVLRMLDAPLGEVEDTMFGMLREGVRADVKTASASSEFLISNQSSRVGEFNTACQARFERSTVFKTPQEIAQLKKKVMMECIDDETKDGSEVLP